ncbi:hypothetical protein [Mesorhizobium sp. B1-1-5]|uniref:hypothetical protein n=1 Tax=Mesorhizobium sp. B1-1-5 TaxID=2589979 RepID=UPI001129D4A3|nr:hypothetical protein [Mesorhizobium sp. B1-1-5]TPN90158.1 hypothetical protein FJ980_29580 [Mesorhizobium sp. B1-1-5]
MEPITKFWLVWCTSRGSPLHKHWSKGAARTEAERLSRQNPGQAFIVLAAVDAVVSPIMGPQSVKLIKPDPSAHTPDDDIPF